MPGNPLTNPHWAAEMADTVERVVGTVRDRATTPIVHITRALVYGLLAALLGLAALVLVLIAVTRALQALLDTGVEWPRAVYLSYLILGGILCLVGMLLFKKRHPTGT